MQINKIEVTIAGCPTINLNSRVNHFKRASEMKDWKTISGMAFRRELYRITGQTIKPNFEKAKIKIHRYFTGKSQFKDYDNLVASMKPIIDGAVLAGVLIDDGYKITGPWEVEQTRVSDIKEDYLRVVIERVS